MKDRIIYQLRYDNTYIPKDITFIDDNHVLVYYTRSKIVYDTENRDEVQYISRVVYFSIDINKKTNTVLCYKDIPNSHGDCIRYYKGIIFISNQVNDTIDILQLKDNIITIIDCITGFSFPHGIDISSNGLYLFVSNYGTNTVDIIDIPKRITDYYYYQTV
jgi:DNA-binding beta-propeller fold protein YncE